MSYRKRRNLDPRVITLRYPAVCAETGKQLNVGTQALYYPIGKSVFSLESQEFRKFQEEAFDHEVLGANY